MNWQTLLKAILALAFVAIIIYATYAAARKASEVRNEKAGVETLFGGKK